MNDQAPTALRTAALLCALALAPLSAGAQTLPPGAEHEGPAFTFNRILDDVYHAVGTGSLAVGANSTVIINQDDVLLVDSHVSPAAAAVLLQELKGITDKPVRYVVDTHYHFDHAHGNQIFPPSVEIIGHEVTREMLASGESKAGRAYPRFVATLPQQIAALRAQLDTTTDAADRAALERRIRSQESYKAATDAVRPTPPNVTLDRRLTLYRGEREIRIEFFGRGHTGGDVVVYLPRERVLVVGDLVSTTLPFMGDGYVPEWIDTLEGLKTLDWDVALPGHGPAFRDHAEIDHLQAYLVDLWAQLVTLHDAGVPVEAAAERIDMRAHAEHYPRIDGVGVDRDWVAAGYALLAGSR